MSSSACQNLSGSQIVHMLSSQIACAEEKFKETISRLKDIDEYFDSKFKMAKDLIKTMPRHDDAWNTVSYVIDVLGEIMEVVEKMREIEALALTEMVPIEELEEKCMT